MFVFYDFCLARDKRDLTKQADVLLNKNQAVYTLNLFNEYIVPGFYI